MRAVGRACVVGSLRLRLDHDVWMQEHRVAGAALQRARSAARPEAKDRRQCARAPLGQGDERFRVYSLYFHHP